MNVAPHHIGCAVAHLDQGLSVYTGALGCKRISRPFDVCSQHVRVRFVELADNLYLELIAPTDSRAKLTAFMKTGFYHLCFLVDDLAATGSRLVAEGCYAFPTFASEAFDGRACQFFQTPQPHLIELVEMSPGDFATFFDANLSSID